MNRLKKLKIKLANRVRQFIYKFFDYVPNNKAF